MTSLAAKSVRLLIAEDNPLIRDLIQKGLDPHCEIIMANDGGDALLKVIDDPPDAMTYWRDIPQPHTQWWIPRMVPFFVRMALAQWDSM